MNWLVPENELDREQRKFLESLITEKDNEHIDGFPGSGKTILLLYAAKRLKDKEPNAKILFVEFTHALIKMIEAAIQQLPYHDIKAVTYYEFDKNIGRDESFDYILCDEVQDVPRRVIDKMKQHASRVIIAGDPNQSIYERDPQWKLPPCTQTEINSILNPSSMSLSVIHRLTRFVIGAVNKFMPEMNIMAGYSSMMRRHVKIRLWKGANQQQEVHAIMEDALAALQVGDSVGILLPTHNKIQKFTNRVLLDAGKPEWIVTRDQYNNPEYDKLNSHFEENGIPIQFVANGFGDFTTDKQKITLITYHSSKGLDFDKVFLPFCNHTDEYSTYSDSDKTLLMVAITRSRGDLIISFTKELNRFVNAFKEDCTYKNLETDGTPSLFGNWNSLETIDSPNTKSDDGVQFDW